jgi:hypothetical protein
MNSFLIVFSTLTQYVVFVSLFLVCILRLYNEVCTMYYFLFLYLQEVLRRFASHAPLSAHPSATSKSIKLK